MKRLLDVLSAPEDDSPAAKRFRVVEKEDVTPWFDVLTRDDRERIVRLLPVVAQRALAFTSSACHDEALVFGVPMVVTCVIGDEWLEAYKMFLKHPEYRHLARRCVAANGICDDAINTAARYGDFQQLYCWSRLGLLETNLQAYVEMMVKHDQLDAVRAYFDLSGKDAISEPNRLCWISSACKQQNIEMMRFLVGRLLETASKSDIQGKVGLRYALKGGNIALFDAYVECSGIALTPALVDDALNDDSKSYATPALFDHVYKLVSSQMTDPTKIPLTVLECAINHGDYDMVKHVVSNYKIITHVRDILMSKVVSCLRRFRPEGGEDGETYAIVDDFTCRGLELWNLCGAPPMYVLLTRPTSCAILNTP